MRSCVTLVLVALLALPQFAALAPSAAASLPGSIDAPEELAISLEPGLHAYGPMASAAAFRGAERPAPSGAAAGEGPVITAVAQPAAAEPQRTVMQCLGSETLTRACHFQNIFFDLQSRRFQYYGAEGTSAEFFGDNKPGYPWLRLSRCEPPYQF